MASISTVLWAEDDENDIFLLQRASRKPIANNLHICRDGEAVLEYLKGAGPYADRSVYPFPDMLILDIKMPKMSGLDVLRWLHAHPHCHVIPTIIFSHSKEPRDVELCYSLGANSYVVKPSGFDELQQFLSVIKVYWSMCELPATPSRSGRCD